ncbi:Transcriptional regulator of ribosomal biogenesis proteins [Neofusicoccum ribis]|uniref:Transcriptional regulator of ribosomal biogenesis proteins n=1 Tax=Neofusicoccum ribis TaxID=45134 RepID=A0ABR3SM27_9PEZI
MRSSAKAKRRIPPAWFDPAPLTRADPTRSPIDITVRPRSTAKLASHTPPPLSHSPNSLTTDRDRESTVDPTPVTTPVFRHPEPAVGRPKKERDLYFSWHRSADAATDRPHDADQLEFDGDILFDDAGDCPLLLFPASPPASGVEQQAYPHRHASQRAAQMAALDGPVDISTVRQNSTSPRNQTSTLSAALQGAAAQPIATPTSAPRSGNEGRLSVGGRQDSISHVGSYYGTGARPISMKDRPRRESTTAGSLLNGMSWGGVSVGSWIRDDIVMAGTSPYAFGRSPSFHSSSYLPKMEANFMKDFNCCGLTLDSLHELLQHFEECHAAPSATMQRPSISGQGGFNNGGRNSISSGGINPQQAENQQIPNQQNGFRPSQFQNNQQFASNGFNKSQLSTVQDMDTLEDMEMDDPQTPMGGVPQQQFNSQPPQFGQNNDRQPQLNIGLANNVQNQAFRTSTPTTPNTSHPGFPLQNNPTVSSVNTPTLGAAGQSQKTPDSSVPGTPGEFDQDLSNYFGGLPMGMNGQMMQGNNMDFGNMGFNANGYDGFDGTIDQPAKRLYSKQGGGLTPQQLQFALRQGKLGTDSELAKQLRAQQMLMANGGMFPGEEIKPFKCPVIGCEKAYKNQNGLKYHKQHGHQNQQLKENADGTFSIVDPETSVPYPGTVGMEKEKPYRCETCGKRYKNLNGLKYHRAHSPPCNPELKLNAMNLVGLAQNMQGMNVNVAGAGLAGMGDGMF